MADMSKLPAPPFFDYVHLVPRTTGGTFEFWLNNNEIVARVAFDYEQALRMRDLLNVLIWRQQRAIAQKNAFPSRKI